MNYLIFSRSTEKRVSRTKRAAIADEIEDLGEAYRDVLRDGWVKHLSAAYPPGSNSLSLDLSAVRTKVVVEDDARAYCCLTNQLGEHPAALLVADEVCFGMKTLNRGRSTQEKAQMTRK